MTDRERAGVIRAVGAAALLAIGAVLAATVFGLFFYHSRAARDSVEVVGAASRDFQADVVKWRITLSRQVTESELQHGYGQLQRDVDRLVERLHSKAVPDTAINLQPASANPVYNPTGHITSYRINQSLFVVSTDLPAIEGWALNPLDLLASGLILESSQLEYYYTGIDQLKRQLLADATEDARRRAAEIARSSSRSVGRLTGARAGVFQITEPYSTEVAAYGVYNTTSRRKEITVTVHASFLLD